MPSNTPEASRLEELWEDFLGGTLDDSHSQDLLRLLEQFPSELHRVRRDAAVDAALRYLVAAPASRKRLRNSVLSRLGGDTSSLTSGRFTASVMSDLHSRRSGRTRQPRSNSTAWLAVFAAAALLMLTVALWPQKTPQSNPLVVVPEIKKAPAPAPTIATGPAVVALQLPVTLNGRALNAGERATVPADGSISVGAAGRAALELTDGSRIQAAGDTAINVREDDSGRLLRLDRGQLDVRAAHQTPGKALSVKTAFGTARVVGTEFSVHAYSRLSWIGVREGTVNVSAISEKSGAGIGVGVNQEITLSSAGLGPLRNETDMRVLTAAQLTTSEYSDPLRTTALQNTVFRNYPIMRTDYRRPAKNSVGWADVVWPVKLGKNESRFEIWIRPLRVGLSNPEYRLMKVDIMAALEDCDYSLGSMDVRPDDRDWICIQGSLEQARLNWSRSGVRPVSPDFSNIRVISMRAYLGDIDLEHTGMIIYRSGP